MKYDAIIKMGENLLLLYDKDEEIEIPFTYVRTFPRQIYQLDCKKDNDKPKDISEMKERNNINLDSCIEFQQEALDYFLEKDIQDIKITPTECRAQPQTCRIELNF